MSQFEEENDLGRGGGEVGDETMRKAWETAEEREGDLGRPAPEPEKPEGV